MKLPLHNARYVDVFDLLSAHVSAGPTVESATCDALGRVLTQEVTAAIDFPPFDRALMDGFAVLAADLAEVGTTLPSRGLIRAGDTPNATLAPGTCLRINTGAVVPKGADAVVMIEQCELLNDDRVRFEVAPKPNTAIERRGTVRRRGDRIIDAGARVGPGALAALIAAGVSHVSTAAPPRVALLCTGDELLDPLTELSGGHIYESNSHVLAPMIRSAGGNVTRIPSVADEADALRAALSEGLKHQLLVVVGGMSKGSHDLVPSQLESLGVSWLVTSLALKPGKPAHIGRAENGAWVLGLPGNPVSCAVCFLLFGRALLRGLQGQTIAAPALIDSVVDTDVPKNGKRDLLQPAVWTIANGSPVVSPIQWRGSGDPFGLAIANALIYRPANADAAKRGDSVPVMLLESH